MRECQRSRLALSGNASAVGFDLEDASRASASEANCGRFHQFAAGFGSSLAAAIHLRVDPLPEAADFVGGFACRRKFADRKAGAERILVIVAHDDEGSGNNIGQVRRGPSPKAVTASSTRRPRIGVWLSTKANGFLQALTTLSVDAAASMSAMLGRAGIRHRSA